VSRGERCGRGTVLQRPFEGHGGGGTLFMFGTDGQFLGGKLERKDFSRDVRGGLCPQVVHGGRVETLLELH
jgi:hypothetical protein